MTAPSPPRKTAWFPGPPRWSAEEDGRSYPISEQSRLKHIV